MSVRCHENKCKDNTVQNINNILVFVRSLSRVLGSMFYAIVTSDNDFFRECYGTLRNFMELYV